MIDTSGPYFTPLCTATPRVGCENLKNVCIKSPLQLYKKSYCNVSLNGNTGHWQTLPLYECDCGMLKCIAKKVENNRSIQESVFNAAHLHVYHKLPDMALNYCLPCDTWHLRCCENFMLKDRLFEGMKWLVLKRPESQIKISSSCNFYINM